MVVINETVNKDFAARSPDAPHIVRAVERRNGIRSVGRHDNRWIYTGLVAYLTGLPQGGTVEAWPRRAGQGDRGRPQDITYGATRIPYGRKRISLPSHERLGLCDHRL